LKGTEWTNKRKRKVNEIMGRERRLRERGIGSTRKTVNIEKTTNKNKNKVGFLAIRSKND
jgi:hypothetical protein